MALCFGGFSDEPYKAPCQVANPDVFTGHLDHVDVTLALEEDSRENEGCGIHKNKQAQGFNKLKILGQQTVKC